ncbi:hypothetical protein ACIBF5_10040 [Micromonospora sp. NPDC050417]|uniref:hypothetical protein n=1 Tax=Micromonospora sp. NPDC050417 TaxID=3364280 RepID=UPI0037986258
MPGQTTLTHPQRRAQGNGLRIPAQEMPKPAVALAGAPARLSLLYLLNVTNPGRLSADSGLLFADILAPAMLDQDVRFTVAGPVGVSDPRAGHIEVSAPTTKYRARFAFDVDACAALLRRVRPEVVVANQIEAAPGVRAAMLEAGSDALLAGYCHYLPFHLDPAGDLCLDPSLNDAGLGHPVLLSFFAGLMACDRVMVHSSTAERWVTETAGRLGLDLGDRVRIVPAPADPNLVRRAGEVPDPGLPVGIYNHRLYEHYGTGEFLEVARQLGAAGVGARLRVTDLLGKRRPDRIRLDDSPERYLAQLGALDNVEIVADTVERERYRRLLAGATFAFAPFRPGTIWSMSVVDCLSMGLPLLTRRLGWLGEIGDPELMFDYPGEAVAIVRRLVTDPVFAAAAADRAIRSTAGLTPDVVATAYLKAITR